MKNDTSDSSNGTINDIIRSTFWGVDLRSGKGKNHLGKLLMKIREEIRNSEK